MNATITSATRPRIRRGTAAAAGQDTESIEIAPSDIAQRAYELFLARGRTHGNDIEDWLAAENELTQARVSDTRVA